MKLLENLKTRPHLKICTYVCFPSANRLIEKPAESKVFIWISDQSFFISGISGPFPSSFISAGVWKYLIWVLVPGQVKIEILLVRKKSHLPRLFCWIGIMPYILYVDLLSWFVNHLTYFLLSTTLPTKRFESDLWSANCGYFLQWMQKLIFFLFSFFLLNCKLHQYRI